MWNPEGIFKECGTGGEQALRRLVLFHPLSFHGLFSRRQFIAIGFIRASAYRTVSLIAEFVVRSGASKC